MGGGRVGQDGQAKPSNQEHIVFYEAVVSRALAIYVTFYCVFIVWTDNIKWYINRMNRLC